LVADEKPTALDSAPTAAGGEEVFAFPLSLAQRRFWALDQLEPGNPAYNVAVRTRLTGPLSVEALERALREIVRRHETLRTVFGTVDGELSQIVSPPASGSPLVTRDISDLPPEDRAEEAERCALEWACVSFDMAAGPLWRTALVRLAPEEHILFITAHHIICDGWSMGLFTEELASLYEAFAEGRESPLAELPIQYADFTIWQQEWLKNNRLEDQLRYWTDKLSGLAPLRLPTDRPRPESQTFNGAIRSILLPRVLTDALTKYSHGHDTTLFTTMLAALQALLFRYTGQSDVFVGSPIANRNNVEIERLIGVFNNLLVLRTDLGGDPTFSELLGRTRTTMLETVANQDILFEQIMEHVPVKRDGSRTPTIPVNFIFQRGFLKPLQAGPLSFTPIPSKSPGATYDLNVFIVERAEGWRTSCEYNTDLFEADTIDRLLRHYQVLLEGVVADPDRPISALPLLTPGEILEAWGMRDDRLPEAPPGVAHARFEDQAARTPDSPAAVFPGGVITYRELEERSRRLATRIGALAGVGEVALLAEGDVDQVVGLLAVLRAGCACLPISADCPPAWATSLLGDVKARLLLANRPLTPAAEGCDCQREPLTGAAGPSSPQPAASLAAPAPEALALLRPVPDAPLRPAVIEVSHRALAADLLRLIKGAEIGPADRVLLEPTAIGEGHVAEALWVLSAGACLALPGSARWKDGRALLEDLERYKASVIVLSPSMLEALLPVVGPDSCPDLRMVITRGEPVSPALERRVLGRLARLTLWHAFFGCEEAGEFAFSRTCIPDAADEGFVAAVAGGTPAMVLDGRGNFVPRGVPGELYLDGGALARGYRNRPTPTAERFVPDPMAARPASRWFRSGDRVRIVRGGRIVFIGRLDARIRRHGSPVEPGEVEAAIAELETVRQVVVAAVPEPGGGEGLAAYVVPRDGAVVTPAEIDQHLRSRVPWPMIPGHVVLLDALPVTAEGTADRAALPLPESGGGKRRLNHLPETPTERELAALWSEVLGLSPVRVDDNFFELGGHSLLAARLFARVHQVLGVNLPLATLFGAPTIRAMAAVLDTRGEPASGPGVGAPAAVRGWRPLVCIQEGRDAPPLFLVHAVGGNVLNFYGLLGELGPSQPVYGLQARGLDGVAPPFSSIGEMARSYTDEIRSVQQGGPYFVGGACFGGVVALEIARNLAAAGEQVAFVAMLDSVGPGPKGYEYVYSYSESAVGVLRSGGLPLRRRLGTFLDRGRRSLRSRTRNAQRRIRCAAARWTRTPIPLPLLEGYLSARHREILKKHVVPPYSASPLTLFRGPATLKALDHDPSYGWTAVAEGGLEVLVIKAAHDQFLESPELHAQFAEKLRAVQGRAGRRG
jgi:aspartate racemase